VSVPAEDILGPLRKRALLGYHESGSIAQAQKLTSLTLATSSILWRLSGISNNQRVIGGY
jgi:hypothetical protein